MFLEESEYIIREKSIHKCIIDDIEISSDSDEKTLLEKIQMEKNSDCEEKSNEEILKKIQMEKNCDEGNSD